MEKVKILVAGDHASIHTNRFVSLLQDIGYEVRVFQSEYRCWVEEHLRNTVIYVAFADAPAINGNTKCVCAPFYMNCDTLFYEAVRRLQTVYNRSRPREKDLMKVLKNWKPDIIFSLKMQNDAYTVAAAKEILGSQFKAKWVHFNWGTDIEFFGKHPDYTPEHLPKIKKVLSLCDYHIADCRRDVRQAIEYGLRGVSLGHSLAFGGFDLSYIKEIKSENTQGQRDVILVKGRQGGFVGKAFHVLEALHRVPHLLKEYKIKIIMATPDTESVADFLTQVDGIEYEIIPHISYRELLGLFARSRIAISATDVDGTPSFLTEAMAMGAFPIHSDMESIREWVEDGVNGILFPVDNIDLLTRGIERSLTDDALVDSARIKNWDIVQDKMDRRKIKDHIEQIIEYRILGRELYPT